MTRAKAGVGAIEWTARALADLREIDDYIAADDPIAAEKWVARLMGKIEAASRMPMSGRVVPELARPDVREVLLRSYRLVYGVRASGIVVPTVFEGHHRFPGGVVGTE